MYGSDGEAANDGCDRGSERGVVGCRGNESEEPGECVYGSDTAGLGVTGGRAYGSAAAAVERGNSSPDSDRGGSGMQGR